MIYFLLLNTIFYILHISVMFASLSQFLLQLNNMVA